MEDVDCAFPTREEQEKEEKTKHNYYRGKVTFSGLLNAIDGILAQEGRILVMTTNHLEKLDPALIRCVLTSMSVCFSHHSMFISFHE